MTITEVIAELEKIQKKYGDLVVLHQNDWTNFLVTLVRVEPFQNGRDPIQNCKQPAHVVLEDDGQFYECETGKLTAPRNQR